ncbi:peptidoglycan DD-metalloendopeptidase family protein [Patescibacteria group bacterium]|nr:peptidoglycan DD-metalloendopeptidase family protein [Patescibacteria group bacterium]
MKNPTGIFDRLKPFVALAVCFSLVVQPGFVMAQAVDDGHAHEDEEGIGSALKDEVDDLNGEVKKKEQSLKELDGVIAKYKDRINQQSSAQVSLQNQLVLLENRVAEKELSIQRTRGQIELANLELQRVKAQIEIERQTLARREAALGGIIAEIQDMGAVGEFETFIARPSLSDYFTRMEELKRVENDLSDATGAVKEAKIALEEKQKKIEEYRLTLQDQARTLEKEQQQLEMERAAKTSLLAETQDQEAEFQRILYELRQQKQEESNDIAALEDRIKDKLDSIDEALARGDILLNWPFKPPKGISALFHDKSYPFRKLFEHPGVDLPTPVGTPVRAAAGGYVAFNRTGKQYGNYVMIVHPGGVATVYAHLSRFSVKADTYVERGDVIGLSGGRPGDQGAGLSTGPHLHFEMRQDGIPVDPLPYLPALD